MPCPHRRRCVFGRVRSRAAVHVNVASKKFDYTSHIVTVSRASIPSLARQHVLFARVDNFTVHGHRLQNCAIHFILVPSSSQYC